MSFDALPSWAAWRHVGARDAFEVVYLRPKPSGVRAEGHTAAVESGQPWAISYQIELDARWRTRRAELRAHWPKGQRAIVIETDGEAHWLLDGVAQPALDGCLDLDLEASAFTNTFPIHRLDLAIEHVADAPAAYVRALDLGLQRLPQQYRRLADRAGRRRYDYRSPEHDYAAELEFDASGLVLDYPGIALRVDGPVNTGGA